MHQIRGRGRGGKEWEGREREGKGGEEEAKRKGGGNERGSKGGSGEGICRTNVKLLPRRLLEIEEWTDDSKRVHSCQDNRSR